MTADKKAVTVASNALRYQVKRMLEREGTRYGIYKDGKLWESGFVTERAALELVAELSKLPV